MWPSPLQPSPSPSPQQLPFIGVQAALHLYFFLFPGNKKSPRKSLRGLQNPCLLPAVERNTPVRDTVTPKEEGQQPQGLFSNQEDTSQAAVKCPRCC